MGAPSHLATLLLAQKSNLKITTVPYKGTAPALVDIAGGHSQILMDSIIALLPMAKTGKVKPIVTTSAKRSAIAPDIPTAQKVACPAWSTPAGMAFGHPWAHPADRVQMLNAAINESVNELTKSGAFAALGIDGITESVDQFTRFIATDVAQNAELLRGAGFKPE
jgi:tripartite-type tricarboxylate transporter receptor subunit TctC